MLFIQENFHLYTTYKNKKMLNKFYKKNLNKYSRFFEFIFFLRHLLIIFFIATAVFVTIPIFFNYEKKAEVVKSYLFKNYNFKIINYEKIKYNIFPTPNLELTNVQLSLKSSIENLNIKKTIIYLNFFNIYNYEDFSSRKLILKDSNIKFQISNFKHLINQLFKKRKKLYFDNLNFKMIDDNVAIITLNEIKFTNFGYNKNLIRGKIFDKNFEIKVGDNHKNFNLKLLNTGIKASINLEEDQTKNIKVGIFKSKILNTNFKSNFEYDGKGIKIYNAFFRSKNISFKKKSEIVLSPFLDINSNFIIEEFNTAILNNIDLNKILKYKELLRKINSKSEINFKSKKFNRKFFEDLNLSIDLAFGRVHYFKQLSNKNNVFLCDGNINFLEEYPLLFFDCYIKLANKKEFLKKFSIKSNEKKEKFHLKVKGNLSVINKKVNFKSISIDDNYKASKEDLKYFKNTFENILFDKTFFEIFDLKKIKKFIVEIS
jgi:hypothetical protein